MPGRKEEERVIDGVELKCVQFQGMEALAMVPRVSLLAKWVVQQAKASDVSGNDGPDSLLPLVFDVLTALTGEELQTLSRDLLSGTKAKDGGVWIDLKSDKAIDSAFGGDLPTLIKAVLFAAEVNFLRFFVATRPGGPSPVAAPQEKRGD
jgi:hypothetical protein